MKGIVFTEFLELVENKFGDEVADNIIDNSDLVSEGAYTAVGTYDHGEMFQLVANLSKETNVPVPDLLKVYGEYLFKRFTTLFPSFFENEDNAFTLLSKIDDFIHVEVKKLYADAELPKFDHDQVDEKTLKLTYTSTRHMEDFAEGLMQGCLDHFNQKATIEREKITENSTLFTIALI